MLAGLAQEELERVCCRLDGSRHSRRRWGSVVLLRFHDELDRSAVELRVHSLQLERIEFERLEQLDQLHLTQLSARLGSLEQRRELLVAEDGLDLDRHVLLPCRCSQGWMSRACTQPKHAGPQEIKCAASRPLPARRLSTLRPGWALPLTAPSAPSPARCAG